MYMGIFDRPKNYRMSKPSTIISYEERYQRLVEIINIVITLLTSNRKEYGDFMVLEFKQVAFFVL